MIKQLLANVICLTIVTACSTLKSGINMHNIDTKVRPQDNFYRYVNGGWLDKTQIPADKSSYSSFTALRDKSRENIKAIIEETARQSNPTRGSNAQKIGDLYRSFMNTDKLNQLGITPLKSEFKRIDALDDHRAVSAYFARSQIIGTDAPFGFYVNNDSKKPDNYIAYLTQSGLGLPDREYYLKNDDKSVKLRNEYLKHISKMLSLAKIEQPQNNAEKILVLETAIAKIHWSRKDNRNRNLTYNKFFTSKLTELNQSVDWKSYLLTAGISSEKTVIVRQPGYLKQFDSLFKKTTISDWKMYFKWTLLNTSASRLSSDFDKQNFAFYHTILSGTPQQEERWKRAVNSVNNLLGEMVGKRYVEQHFKPEAKTKMKKLVENLRTAYRQAIIDLEWMGTKTKKQALDKLAKFTPKIGYPDRWRDYSALEINADDLIGNYRRAAQFSHQRALNKLGKPIDKTEWFMSPQTVNAYYNPVMNEIVFPAAILQPPFFFMDADEAVNYGGIGAVIGHEMGHGFDDQGAKSDGNGILRNWWTKKDYKEFKVRTQKLASQYSQFEALPGEYIQGELTLGENIGDLGGLTIAHRAYMLSLNGKKPMIINGLSGEQRFFMGWAQIWATKYRDEALRKKLATDPHSPGPFRANGPLMNMSEFIDAYNVKPDDGMYRRPGERVKIW